MAGGIFSNTNGVIPGVFINRKTRAKSEVAQSEDGVVVYCLRNAKWGETGKFIDISSLEECQKKLGFDSSSEEMRFIVEMFRGSNRTSGANKVRVYVPQMESQKKATATVGSLTITAKCPGTRGNDMIITITPNLDTEISDGVYAVYVVRVILEGQTIFTQTVGDYTDKETYTLAKIEDLNSNDYVVWSGSGDFTATAGTNLVGGASGVATATEYATFLEACEKVFFNALCYDDTDDTIRAAVATFVKRQCEERGYYCQAIMPNYNTPDYEGCISVKNGINLSDGYVLTNVKATWWIAGCTAGAKANESLTHVQHPLAKSVINEYSKNEIEQYLNDGHIVFINEFEKIMVCKDINTYHSTSTNKGDEYKSNRCVRTINDFCNYCYRTYDETFIGKLDNDESGRDTLKGDVVGYCNIMQGNHEINNFSNEDITVEAIEGTKDKVMIYAYFETVDSINGIYINLSTN